MERENVCDVVSTCGACTDSKGVLIAKVWARVSRSPGKGEVVLRKSCRKHHCSSHIMGYLVVVKLWKSERFDFSPKESAGKKHHPAARDVG